MARWLKRGRDAEKVADEDQKVRATVEGMLADIAARGDPAVREFSTKLDGWDRDDYRLTDAEIRECLAQLSARALDDIRFAQAQVRNFAKSSATPYATSRSRRCPESCSATRTSRSSGSGATCPAENIRCSPPPTCR